MGKTSKKSNHYILILCGGTGPRLWPLSRVENPKQFLTLFSDKNLLEETISRSLQITQPENIFLITNKKYQEKINQLAKIYIPVKNIIYEPDKKNTAMALLYGTSLIHSLNPNAVITSMPSDHYIKNIKNLKKDVNLAVGLSLKYHSIVTIGFKPSEPTPSYGYISFKKELNKYTVLQFIEKPTRQTAQNFIDKGYYWNSDILTFTPRDFFNQLQKYNSKYYQLYLSLEKDVNNPKTVEKIYKISPNLNLANAVFEKSKDLLMVPGHFTWSDVGEWKTIYSQLKKNKKGIAQLNSDTQIVEVNSKKCLVSTAKNKLIGLVGVENLAIIDTPDALLICNIAFNESYKVRNLVSKIVNNKKTIDYFLTKNG